MPLAPLPLVALFGALALQPLQHAPPRTPRSPRTPLVSLSAAPGDRSEDDATTPASNNRRRLLQGAAAALVGTAAPNSAHAELSPSTNYPLWPALPLAPYGKRKTLMREAVPGKVWTFDQLFGVFYVHVPIRMTVIAMESGGLFVYAPVAPTKECLALFQPLVDKYGPVRHVVLPSVAPEHKVLAGPFARAAPCRGATFWTTDKQYSFPVNLPETFLGFPGEVRRLPPSSRGLDLRELGLGEFEFEVLTAKASKESVYQEAAFFHKPTKSLLLCDAVVSTGIDPPEILLSEPEYRRALLYHARDDPLEKVEDTPETWRKGWQRIALFGNFFQPGALVSLENDRWLAAAPRSPMPELGWAGVLPFAWRDTTPVAFEAFRDGGKPVVVPIIQIILSRAPDAARKWVDVVTSWDFQRVLPAHFETNLAVKPKELRQAFAFLDEGKNSVRFCDEDVAFLREALDSLPPDLALYDTPLGPLRGKACGLERGQLADEGPNAKRYSMAEYSRAMAKVRGSGFRPLA